MSPSPAPVLSPEPSPPNNPPPVNAPIADNNIKVGNIGVIINRLPANCIIDNDNVVNTPASDNIPLDTATKLPICPTTTDNPPPIISIPLPTAINPRPRTINAAPINNIATIPAPNRTAPTPLVNNIPSARIPIVNRTNTPSPLRTFMKSIPVNVCNASPKTPMEKAIINIAAAPFKRELIFILPAPFEPLIILVIPLPPVAV